MQVPLILQILLVILLRSSEGTKGEAGNYTEPSKGNLEETSDAALMAIVLDEVCNVSCALMDIEMFELQTAIKTT